jgi:hypothetical protein
MRLSKREVRFEGKKRRKERRWRTLALETGDVVADLIQHLRRKLVEAHGPYRKLVLCEEDEGEVSAAVGRRTCVASRAEEDLYRVFALSCTPSSPPTTPQAVSIEIPLPVPLISHRLSQRACGTGTYEDGCRVIPDQCLMF